MNKRSIGSWAERVACEFLKNQGYEIVTQNFYSRFGEVDIIARDGEYLVFIEVKYRKDTSCGMPSQAVTPRKMNRIRQTSMHYLKRYHISFEHPIRYDVVEILGKKIRVIKHAF